MPIPQPTKDETQDEFIGRCMEDKTMNDEYPDQKQRLAICFSQWKKEKKGGNMKQVETRMYPVELRVEGDDTPKIKGHAAVFDKLSSDLGGFREKITPGAFKRALETSDPAALWNHNADIVLGRKSAGTLLVQEDDKGLYFEITPPSWADGYIETIKRGDVTGASFAFIVKEGGDEWDKTTRTVNEIEELFDISPCTYPAYPQTKIKVRMDETDKNEIVERVGRYLQPEKLDIQGAEDKEPGRVDSLDIKHKRLDVESI